jgi:subtilase family serine protease
VTISASPSSVRVGFSSTISWSSTNATACNGTNGTVGWPGYQDTSGAFNSGSLTSTTTFTLTCTGTGGSIAGSVTVTALPVAAPL